MGQSMALAKHIREAPKFVFLVYNISTLWSFCVIFQKNRASRRWGMKETEDKGKSEWQCRNIPNMNMHLLPHLLQVQ